MAKNTTPPTEPTTAAAPAAGAPAKPWVKFEYPYGDFPEYKRGDICYTPTPEMLRVAESSSCLTILNDEQPV